MNMQRNGAMLHYAVLSVELLVFTDQIASAHIIMRVSKVSVLMLYAASKYVLLMNSNERFLCSTPQYQLLSYSSK
jgi:hypothetical protein